jgi:hypothetical protein
MILYKEEVSQGWRIPRSVYRKRTSDNSFVASEQVRMKSSGNFAQVVWHRNQAPSTNNTNHPFWMYSMNPFFAIAENNAFNNAREISFDTGINTGGGHYTAGFGACTVNITGKNEDNYGDAILQSKFPLNVNPGITYRSSVTVSSKNAQGSTLTFLTGFWSAPTYQGAEFKGTDSATLWGPEQSISTGTYNYDAVIPSGHVWARPIIKIIANGIGSTFPVSYTFSQWIVSRRS